MITIIAITLTTIHHIQSHAKASFTGFFLFRKKQRQHVLLENLKKCVIVVNDGPQLSYPLVDMFIHLCIMRSNYREEHPCMMDELARTSYREY